jgi:hypothetical protein
MRGKDNFQLQLHQKWRRKKPRPPLRTFSELCDELGVKRGVLSHLLGHAPNAPKPELVVQGHQSAHGRVSSNTWYEPVAFRAWFHSLNKQQEAA